MDTVLAAGAVGDEHAAANATRAVAVAARMDLRAMGTRR